MAPNRAYVDALVLLGRRELSEAQLRRRLARKAHSPAEIDDAVSRLRDERAVDDTRVAESIARVETVRKKHGRQRVARAIEHAGIARDIARRAADQAFAEIDEDAHLQAALDKRLHGRPVTDEAEFRRLCRYLAGQGFETDRVLAALKARRRR